jgi:hypothetical protein
MMMQNSASTGRFYYRLKSCLSCLPAIGIGLLGVSAHAQPGSEIDLFPVQRHAAWTYDVTMGRQAVALTAAMTRVRASGDASEVTLQWQGADGRRTQTEVYRVSATEVARVASGREGQCRYVPPFPVLRSPLVNGRRWTWKGVLQYQRRDVPAEAAFSASGPSSVNTPSGPVQAMKVHCDLTLSLDGQQRTETTDQWFAPGVGIVQQRMQNGAEVVEGRLTGFSLKRNSGPGPSTGSSSRSSLPTWNGLPWHGSPWHMPSHGRH